MLSVMKRNSRVVKISLLLSTKTDLLFDKYICVYQPSPFGTFFPCVWHQNCTRYFTMASERSPPLGSFVLSTPSKIPRLSSPSLTSTKPPELPVSNQSQKEARLVSSDVGFEQVSLINVDTVTEVNELEKEIMLPKNAGQKRKVGDEVVHEEIKPQNSDVMMKFVVTGLNPSSLELEKKSTILPSSLLQGVTNFVRKTVVTDTCKSEPSGLVKHSGNSLIPNNRVDDKCELSTTLEMLSDSVTENIDVESEKLCKDTSLATSYGENKSENTCVDIQSLEETERLLDIIKGSISTSSSSQSKELHLIKSAHKKNILISSCCEGDTCIKSDRRCKETDLDSAAISPEIQELHGIEPAKTKSQSSLSAESNEDGCETQHDRFTANVDGLSTEKVERCLDVTSENLFEDIDVQDLRKEPSMIKTTETKLAGLKDAFDISVLFSDRFDREFKKYKRQAKKRAKEIARKQKRKEFQSNKKQSEEGEDEDSGKVTKKKKHIPNYFIAIQITNPVIHEALRKVQKRVVEQNKEFLPALNPIPTLHLTVFVMHLANNEDIQRAKDALDDCYKELQGQFIHNPLILDIHGLGHFHNEVVFAKVFPEENVQKLQKIADVVETCFEAHDIPSVDKKGFKPHITVMKLSRARNLWKKGIKKIQPHLYQEFVSWYFGIQEVSGLQLCAMLKPKAKSGYYQVEHETVFGETTKASPDDELSKMSCTIVQSCIKAAVYQLEQEKLASEMSQSEKIESYYDQKSELSQDKEMNSYQNEQIEDPNVAKGAVKQETNSVHDDKPKSLHDE